MAPSVMRELHKITKPYNVTYRKEGQSGLFFCCLQMSEVFYVSEELRYLLVVLDKSQ